MLGTWWFRYICVDLFAREANIPQKYYFEKSSLKNIDLKEIYFNLQSWMLWTMQNLSGTPGAFTISLTLESFLHTSYW